MSISSDYWTTFINVDTDGTRDFGTPRLSEGIIHRFHRYNLKGVNYF